MAFNNFSASDGINISGADIRRLIQGLGRNASGVLGRDDLKPTAQTSPNATIKLAPGHVFVPGDGAGIGGMYHAYNDADLTTPAFTATSTNGRKDRVIIRFTAGIPVVEIVQGTAAGTPLEPAITGENYREIALVTLPASTTNVTGPMILDRRQYVGGDSPFLCTSTNRPTPYPGMEIYETNTGRTLKSPDGTSNWVRGPWWTPGGRTRLQLAKTANQTINNNTVTSVGLSVVTNGNLDGWTNPDGFGVEWVVPSGIGGLYAVVLSVSYSAGLGGRAYLDLRHGAAAAAAKRTVITGDNRVDITSVVELDPGNKIKMETFQNTGSAQTVNGAEMLAFRLGA